MPLRVLKHVNVQDVTVDCTGSIAHHNHYDKMISCSSKPIYTYNNHMCSCKVIFTLSKSSSRCQNAVG